jgi:hypothetical protein
MSQAVKRKVTPDVTLVTRYVTTYNESAGIGRREGDAMMKLNRDDLQSARLRYAKTLRGRLFLWLAGPFRYSAPAYNDDLGLKPGKPRPPLPLIIPQDFLCDRDAALDSLVAPVTAHLNKPFPQQDSDILS